MNIRSMGVLWIDCICDAYGECGVLHELWVCVIVPSCFVLAFELVK